MTTVAQSTDTESNPCKINLEQSDVMVTAVMSNAKSSASPSSASFLSPDSPLNKVSEKGKECVEDDIANAVNSVLNGKNLLFP